MSLEQPPPKEAVPGKTASGGPFGSVAPDPRVGAPDRFDPAVVGGVWLLFLLSFPFAEESVEPGAVLVGGLLGLPLVVAGHLAASRCRPRLEHDPPTHARSAALALLAGVGLGATNLGVNLGLSAVDPALRTLLQEHFAEPMPWTRVAAVAVVEEVLFRFFLMSSLAWLVARFVDRPRRIFLFALFGSTFLFGLLHLVGRPMPPGASLAGLYIAGVVAKSGGAGLLFGWVFWRWGLPSAMLMHFAANGAHALLEPAFFS